MGDPTAEALDGLLDVLMSIQAYELDHELDVWIVALRREETMQSLGFGGHAGLQAAPMTNGVIAVLVAVRKVLVVSKDHPALAMVLARRLQQRAIEELDHA